MHKCILFTAVLAAPLTFGQAGNSTQLDPNHQSSAQRQGQTTQQNENQQLNQAQSKPQKPGIVGVIGDSKCGRVHTVAPGLLGAGCTRHCVNDLGANYILITKDKIYTLNGDRKLLDNFAGVSVRVLGGVGGSSINVQSIEPAYSPNASQMQPSTQ